MRACVLLSAALLTAPAMAAPCAGVAGEDKVRVTMEATGVRDARGNVAFTIYPDSKRRFLAKGGKLLRARVPAVAGTTTACAWLTPGSYPIAAYHDANGDFDFNRTLFVPREGYAFSNDAPATLGLPAFERVRVAIGPGATTVRMRMRYP